MKYFVARQPTLPTLCCLLLINLSKSQFTLVNSSFWYLIPDEKRNAFTKREFLKDGPPSPFNKAVIYASWSDENEYYNCLSTEETLNADNQIEGIYCDEWSANEESGGSSAYSDREQETGSCKCYEASMGPHYCTYWYCVQQEIETTYRTVDNGYYSYRIRNINRDTEHTDCVCQYESTSGKYCYQWWCYETGKDGNTETEQYTCSEASSDETYCNRWQGRIISADEKEWSTCKCSRPSNDGYCTYWTCFEKEHKRTYAVNFGWAVAIAGLALIIFAITGLCVFPDNASNLGFNITWAIIGGIFIMGFCTLAAGVLGLLMGAGVVLIIIITIVMVYFLC